jgi:lipopolysaccharide/colanic/teichoic acid biosynthesis glycosyltransferase
MLSGATRSEATQRLFNSGTLIETMQTGWRYRIAGVLGVAALSAMAVSIANQPVLQSVFTTYVPLVWRLEPVVLAGRDLYFAMGLTAAALLSCLIPLFKPRPRRILDIVALTHKRVLVAGSLLATLGFFDYSYRLPRATLVVTVAILFVAVPAWFILIRHSPNGAAERAVIVGDDPDTMAAVLEATELPVIGYVAPPSQVFGTRATPDPIVADGGELESFNSLGGLSRLDEVLVDYDVDTALLAFGAPDRAEFFGALDACYEHGVTAKVHRQHADSVLTSGFGSETLLDVELEPWDTLDHIAKRAFDVAFAVAVLTVVSPVLLVIAILIKLDDGGSILYSQDRTATFGETFTVYKFRSMVTDAESRSGVKISDEDDGGIDPRVTRVGRFLRRTHLDEIPQLWSILVGKMSVVGPRPERPELDLDMETNAEAWRRRWFVKPGLTGLAQINDVTGHEPEKKLRYDIEYIKRQSLWFDLKIVTRQVWQVLGDLAAMLFSR